MGETTLAEAIAAFDAVDCPARKRHLGKDACPACGSGLRDGCQLEIAPAYRVVEIGRLTNEASRWFMGEWKDIKTAPRTGERVRLGHERDTSSMKIDAMFPITGYWNGGQWALTAFFIVPGGKYGVMASEPTHWLPPAPRVGEGEGA